ncbi:uncharacterized protein [Macaca nemestrina]|uniref:uncharacterized protein isoform X2 n=1 Tax=Macaca nemestrina TaxID=9545 RepID=UPI0039B89CDC
MEVSHGARPSQMPNVHVGPLFCRVHITRRKVTQMQDGVDVNLRKLHESERLLSQLPVSPFEGYRTLLSIDGGEWVPLPHSVILHIDRDVHTEAVQAALAKHKEWKMAVPMPSKRRSLVVQTSMDAYTPPGWNSAS